jgi:hypothetical protein
VCTSNKILETVVLPCGETFRHSLTHSFSRSKTIKLLGETQGGVGVVCVRLGTKLKLCQFHAVRSGLGRKCWMNIRIDLNENITSSNLLSRE